MPASGKSTIAARLSKLFPATVLNSDKIRKQLFGLEAGVRVDVPYGEGIYSSGMTALTYGRVLLMAQDEIKKGRSVIVDATFGREHQRREALQLARDMDANVLFIECRTSIKELKRRLETREHGTSVSDARLHHFQEMVDHYEPIKDVSDEWHLRIHTDQSVEENIKTILGHDYYLLCASHQRA
jgi:predicted kinase